MTMSEGQTLMPGDVLATGTVSAKTSSMDVQPIPVEDR
jgi:2-keto-4-pentenoate hydratase/2-oxohepta-3-ene-1,7-dioic acid hydratase in catechol pathway